MRALQRLVPRVSRTTWSVGTPSIRVFHISPSRFVSTTTTTTPPPPPTTTTNDDDIDNVWEWLPPPRDTNDISRGDKYVIPIVEEELLTTEEVQRALVSQGGDNVVVLNLNGDLGNIKQFVIGSGRSTRHLHKMSTSIVQSLKKRNLKRVQGSSGAEGEKDDDWQVVDCHTFLVHLMLPDTRKHLDLEGHWSKKERPVVVYNKNPIAYEQNFAKVLDKYPCPQDYIKTDNDEGDEGQDWNVVKRL